MRGSERLALWALTAASVALLAARLLAATRIGFGDSEALYASYALHPQPAYLDHPGLVGVLARALGGGEAPTPLRAHLATAALATAFPWLVALTCRACGAPWGRALWAAVVVALTPEIAIGLFAMTPDLLLAYAWTGSVALAAHALGARPGSLGAVAAFAGAGLLAGVAVASQVTGLALFVVLAAPSRAHARTPWPWAGLAAGALVAAPVVSFERREGWPLLAHRLVDTQAAAGLSLRNVAALVGGQLVYLSPLTAVLVVLAAREAWRGRRDPAGRLLLLGFVVPLGALLPLCLWSRVAEPHWLAPAFLTLAPAAARARWSPPRRLVVAATAVGALLVAAVHAWVLVPGISAALSPPSADPRLDISNELRGWPEVIAAVREEATWASTPGDDRGAVVVAGPHWVICAQLEAALEGQWPVGCDTPVRDDFDDWWPRARWRGAEVVVWVSDARFEPSVAPWMAARATLRSREVRVDRGGRDVRTFTVTTLGRGATGQRL